MNLQVCKFKKWKKRLTQPQYCNEPKCLVCGCTKEKRITKDIVQGYVGESLIVCDECGTQKNYWAYGYYQYPNTRLGQLKEIYDRRNTR